MTPRAMAAPLARGAMAGALSALPFGLAHALFIAPAWPPVVAGMAAGALAGACVFLALSRALAAPRAGRLAPAMALLSAPLALAAFALRPALGDAAWLWPVALAASLALGWALGPVLGAGLAGRAALAATALLVAAPGEPFVHEGPEPRIVLFFLGVPASLLLAGALAARLAPARARPRGSPG